MSARCEACDPPRKGLRQWELKKGATTKDLIVTLCEQHWQMAKAMGIKYMLSANPVLAEKIRKALGMQDV